MFLSGTGNRTDLVDFRTHGPAANGEIDIDEINIESMSPEEIKVCPLDRKSTRLNSSHMSESRMPSSA